LAAEREASLREFASAGAAELCENGGRLAPLSKLSWEVRGSDDKPLVHIWSEQYNLTRRVIAITDHSDARLVLAVERFGRSRPDRLEFVRIDFERSARELSREEFCERLKGLLASQFPDETVESATISADLEHSLSGNYVRGLTKRGSRYEAFLAVPDGESQDTVNNSLTFALLWLERLRNGSQRGTVGGVRLIVPKETCSVVAHRFAALEPGLAIELYERDPARDSLERIDPRRAGNLHTWLIPRRESKALLAQAAGTGRTDCGVRSTSNCHTSVHCVTGGSFTLSRAGICTVGRRSHFFWLQRYARRTDSCQPGGVRTHDAGSGNPSASIGIGYASPFISGAGGTLAGVSGAQRGHSRGQRSRFSLCLCASVCRQRRGAQHH
jgi:hypothetical protein